MFLAQCMRVFYFCWKLEVPSDGYEWLNLQISKTAWNFFFMELLFFAKVNEYRLHYFSQLLLIKEKKKDRVILTCLLLTTNK